MSPSSGRSSFSSIATSADTCSAYFSATGNAKLIVVVMIPATSRSMKNRCTSAGRWAAARSTRQSSAVSNNVMSMCSMVRAKYRIDMLNSSRKVPHDITANPNKPKWVSVKRLPTSMPTPASSGSRASRLRTAVISSSALTTVSGLSR